MTDLDVHLPAIAAGDADAFSRWLAGAEPALRQRLRPFAARVDVEAVLQEALLRTWQVAPRVVPDGRPDALLRFAARVARNLAVDHARRARVEPVDPAELVDDEAVAPIEPDPHLRAAIVACHEALPPQARRVLDARIEARGGLPDRDLASMLRMSVNTFLRNVGRARQLLRDCLAGRGVTLELG